MKARTYEIEISFNDDEWNVLEEACSAKTSLKEPSDDNIIDMFNEVGKSVIMEKAFSIIFTEHKE